MGKESELFKKRWLEFALNFPIILSKLSIGEYHFLKSQALFFCSSEFRFQNEESFFKRLNPERYKSIEGEIDLSKVREAIKPAVRFVWEICGGHHDKGKVSPLYSAYRKLSLADVSIEIVVNPETFSFQTGYRTHNYLSLARLNFSKLLEDLSIDSIIKCKGCSKYFIDLTQQKRKFCNTACAARHISRTKRDDLRQNHPRKYKAYLKKQRELMRSRRKAAMK